MRNTGVKYSLEVNQLLFVDFAVLTDDSGEKFTRLVSVRGENCGYVWGRVRRCIKQSDRERLNARDTEREREREREKKEVKRGKKKKDRGREGETPLPIPGN